MSSSTSNPRANRFRYVDSPSLLLPPPLPLINLPDEPRLARTGVPGERPTHLPVRRHLPNNVALAALNRDASDDKRPDPPEPELILQESRALVDCEAEEHAELEELSRLHVYEYNQPDVFRDCDAADDTLVFDSLFESGNLLRATRVFRQAANTATSASRRPQQEYELLIHPDIKNSAYRQWFYFEVRNGRPGVTYRFALVNLAKSGALFGQGLQPVVYSERDAATKGVGWRHRGTHVRYDATASQGGNALCFQYEFEHQNDCVFFACLQPYTYTDLMDYLEMLGRDPQRSLTFRRTELCPSLAQNSCDLLSITCPGKDGVPFDERRIIVLSARVHPGEPNSSWMMQGMLDFLTGASSGAAVLRRHFIFKVVPMLNPDGVINGNTRVSLAGWDLNRKWNNPIEQLFPTVFHLKRQLAHFQLRGRVAIYCDLHGHSLHRNIFTYGCWTPKKRASAGAGLKVATALVDDTDTPSAQSYSASVKTDPRVFPMIVARHAPSFSFASCDFKVHKSKVNTARVVVHQELGVANSYTLEASFCGPDFGVHKDTQFSTWDLEEMGRSWCQSVLVYYGLLAQVEALDAAREAQEEETQQSVDERAAVEEQPVQPRGQEAMAPVGVEDDGSCLARDLLRDCEAAITALFAHAGVDRDEEEDHDGNEAAAMDSDLSGAEEEPIPPTTTDERQERSQRTHRRRPKQRYKDAEVPADGEDGCASAPEESPTRKGRSSTSNSHGRKKTVRHKRSRGGVSSSKPATSDATAARKGEGKSKKKKKKKGKRALTAAAPLDVGPMAGDATFSTLGNNPPALLVPRKSAIEPTLKRSGRKAATAKPHSSKANRPRTSRDMSKATARERLQDEAEAEHLSLGSLKLRPLLVSPNNLNPAVLVLPSVLNGGDARPPRVLRTAPAYREFAPSDQQLRSTLARVRSGAPLELPALQRSGRGDQQQHRQLWQRTGDEDDDDDDEESERSEPEADALEF